VEAGDRLDYLESLVKASNVSPEVHHQLRYSRGIFEYECSNVIWARSILSELLREVRPLATGLRWQPVALALADCYLQLNDEEAASLLVEEIRDDAAKIGYRSLFIAARIRQAQLLLNQYERKAGLVTAAEIEAALAELRTMVFADKAMEPMPRVCHLEMRFCHAQDDVAAAIAALEEEMGYLRRLGKLRSLDECVRTLELLKSSRSSQ
jgi:hypothetical protein